MMSVCIYIYTSYRNAMIFWQEVHYEVLQDIKCLMKLLSLVQRVAMSFLQCF